MGLPDLLSSTANPTSQVYKNFVLCFWGHRFEFCWFRPQSCERCKVKGQLQDTDLEQLIPTKSKDLSVEYLFSRSETAGYKGFTGQKPHFELHPETRGTLWCHVHAEKYPA